MIKTIDYKNEFMRKLIHLCALAIPILYLCFDFFVVVSVLIFFCIIAVTIEILRLNFQRINLFFTGMVGTMLRNDERESVSAATMMAVSSLITILVFQKSVAILTLFYFIAGDGIASLTGRRFGKIPVFNKTLEGSVSCLLVCLVIGFVVSDLPLWIWTSGALIITIVELAPMKINDNIRVPLIGGALIEMLTWINSLWIIKFAAVLTI